MNVYSTHKKGRTRNNASATPLKLRLELQRHIYRGSAAAYMTLNAARGRSINK